MSLTDKQRAFVREYLIDFNGTQAAIRAGYSENSARQQAEQMLKLDHIQEAVTEGKEKLEKQSTLTKLDKLKIAEEMAINTDERATDRLKAVEVHNKMLGHNEPDKVEHSGEGFNLNVIKPKE